jgi:hypothetical protein
MRYYCKHNLISASRKGADLTRQDSLGGTVQNRDEHREPVIRAFVALPVETLVEVTVRCLPGSGLCVSATFLSLNRDEQIWRIIKPRLGRILNY